MKAKQMLVTPLGQAIQAYVKGLKPFRRVSARKARAIMVESLKRDQEREAARWLGEWVTQEKGREFSRNLWQDFLRAVYYTPQGFRVNEFTDTALELARKLGMK